MSSPSPSSRRAWIEMWGENLTGAFRVVALLAEGVDRNLHSWNALQWSSQGRPPRGGRG